MFSVQKGAEHFIQDEIVQVRPEPKLCGMSGCWLRCLSSGRGQSVLTDIEPASGIIQSRRDRLPLMHRMWFHSSGWTLGYAKRGRVGSPSELMFLAPDGAVEKVKRLPDVISEVVESHQAPGWLVGCRNGHLYGYSEDGERIWDRVPGGTGRGAGSPPPLWAPIFLLSSSFYGGIGLSDENQVWLLDGAGREQWRSGLPGSCDPDVEMTAPRQIPTRHEVWARLGQTGSDAQSESVGFLRIRAGTAGSAAHRFFKEFELYGDFDQGGGAAQEDESDDDENSVEIVIDGGIADTRIARIEISNDFIAVGDSDSRLHQFDLKGSLQRTFVVGRGPVSAILLRNGQLQASYCGGMLTLFDGNRITGFTKLPDYYAHIVSLGGHVLVWAWQSVWVVDRTGRVIWRCEFEKRVRSVIPTEMGFWVLAGRLIRFRATSPRFASP